MFSTGRKWNVPLAVIRRTFNYFYMLGRFLKGTVRSVSNTLALPLGLAGLARSLGKSLNQGILQNYSSVQPKTSRKAECRNTVPMIDALWMLGLIGLIFWHRFCLDLLDFLSLRGSMLNGARHARTQVNKQASKHTHARTTHPRRPHERGSGAIGGGALDTSQIRWGLRHKTLKIKYPADFTESMSRGCWKTFLRGHTLSCALRN